MTNEQGDFTISWKDENGRPISVDEVPTPSLYGIHVELKGLLGYHTAMAMDADRSKDDEAKAANLLEVARLSSWMGQVEAEIKRRGFPIKTETIQ